MDPPRPLEDRPCHHPRDADEGVVPFDRYTCSDAEDRNHPSDQNAVGPVSSGADPFPVHHASRVGRQRTAHIRVSPRPAFGVAPMWTVWFACDDPTMTRSVLLGDDHAATTRMLRIGSIVVALLLTVLVWAGAAATGRADTSLLALALVTGTALVTSGVIGWRRRPGSRIGPLLVVAGLLFLANGLQVTPWPVPFTLGIVVGESFLNVLGLALLTFPAGRTSTRLESVLAVVIVGLILPGWVLPSLFSDPFDTCPSCPRNLVLLADVPTVLDALALVATIGGVVAAAGFVVVLSGKWRSATPAAQRALTPVLAAGVLLGVVTLGDQVAQLFGAEPARSTAWTGVRLVTILAASLGFLAGLLEPG